MTAELLNHLTSLPSWLSPVLAALAAVVGTAATFNTSRSASRIAAADSGRKDTELLMQQNKQLFDSVFKLHEELAEAFKEVSSLKDEIGRLRAHIETLEAALAQQKGARRGH